MLFAATYPERTAVGSHGAYVRMRIGIAFDDQFEGYWKRWTAIGGQDPLPPAVRAQPGEG